MDNRERTMAILNYKDFDRIPVVHFSFLPGTLKKWCDEGHLTNDEIEGFRKTWSDGSEKEDEIAEKLGFDFNWYSIYHPKTELSPHFEIKILEEMPDGFRKVRNHHGAIELQRDGAGSIPAEVGHLLKGRREWEEHFLPKLEFSMDRLDMNVLEKMKNDTCDKPVGLYCGSLFGIIRNWMGIEGVSYLYADVD